MFAADQIRQHGWQTSETDYTSSEDERDVQNLEQRK